MKEENKILKTKPLVSDVSCDTVDVYCSVDKSCSLCGMANIDFDEECIEEECKIDGVFEYGNHVNHIEENFGFKIMKRMGYKGKGLGKNAQGRKELLRWL